MPLMKTTVTDEHAAGACGLDGAELTQYLLEENKELRVRLLAQRARNRNNLFGLMALALAWGGLFVALIVLRA